MNRGKRQDVYERERELLASVRQIADSDPSAEEVTAQLTILIEAYSKLLRQTEKITRVGDSIQRKLVRAMAEIERKNRDLVEAQKQLLRKEKMVAMNTLVSGIAHELRNPLNFISNLSRMQVQLVDDMESNCSDQPPSSEQWTHLREDLDELTKGARIICDHGERVDAIVARINQLNREDPGVPYPIDLNLLLSGYAVQVRDMLRERCPLPRLIIRENLDREMAELAVSPGDLGFVFTQVITNALEAMEDSTHMIREFQPVLELVTRKRTDRVTIAIRDNGPGLPEEERHKLFTPFYTTKVAGSGHIGLGLYTSLDIIANGYGGQMDFRRDGEFSEFSIELPLPEA